MTATDDFAWNAFAYTYNNYARDGFARARLRFGNLISLESNGAAPAQRAGRHRHCPLQPLQQRGTALDYAGFVAGGTTQRTFTSTPAVNRRTARRGMTPSRILYAADFSAGRGSPKRKLSFGPVTVAMCHCKPAAAPRCRRPSATGAIRKRCWKN